jgi:hypothetical protein
MATRAKRTWGTLPSKQVDLVKTPNKKITVTREQFPYGSDTELEEFQEDGIINFDTNAFSCAVALATGIQDISSETEGFMVRRLSGEEFGVNCKGGLTLAVTTEAEARKVRSYLEGAGWKPLCTFKSRDGKRDLTLWGAFPIV